jgi:hypothetical protein
LASTSSFTSPAAVVKRTRRFCRQAATHSPVSKWVLPVPHSPMNKTGSARSIYGPCRRYLQRSAARVSSGPFATSTSNPTPKITRYLAKHRFGRHHQLLALCSARNRDVPPISAGWATSTLPRPAFQSPDQDPLGSAQTQPKRITGRDWPVIISAEVSGHRCESIA